MGDWMQNVEAQRAKLRELNELSYARMDARLDRSDERLDSVESRFAMRLAESEAPMVSCPVRITSPYSSTANA